MQKLFHKWQLRPKLKLIKTFQTVITNDLDLAKTILNSGGVIGIPTETVYGLAGNAMDRDSIASIFRIKNRPYFNPLIAHIGKIEQLKSLCSNIPEEAQELIDAFWPGPLTLVLPKKKSVPDILTSGLNKVAVRMPSHPMTLELLKSIKYPLAAPSANPYKYVSPTCAQHVKNQIGGSIPLILDGGQCEIGLESTIIGFEDNMAVIYRLGGLAIESIEEVLRKPLVLKTRSDNYVLPGQEKRHYSPGKKIVLIPFEGTLPSIVNPDVLITWKPNKSSHNSLSLDGSEISGASRVFSILRELDNSKIRKIYIECAPEKGLGKAINDRLERAAYPF